MLLNPRRLAALDMYGTGGSARRRRLIRAEFIVGVVGCSLVGVLTLLPRELRQAGVRQLWIVVPFPVVLAAIAQAWSGHRPRMGDRQAEAVAYSWSSPAAARALQAPANEASGR